MYLNNFQNSNFRVFELSAVTGPNRKKGVSDTLSQNDIFITKNQLDQWFKGESDYSIRIGSFLLF